MIKQVQFTSQNTYDTLNNLTEKTKTVWLVFHGIGYLSRYFIRLFEELNPDENYIIAPQAPSKYYKDDRYRRVGASWLTKENTLIDTQNVLNYIDAIVTTEQLPNHVRFVVLGYSQGVSIASRWISSRQVICDDLVLISGGFPKELTASDFTFLDQKTKVTHILGENDPLFTKEAIVNEKERLVTILPQIQFKTHSGGHELAFSSIKDI